MNQHYVTIAELAILYRTIFTESNLRNLIYQADENGITKCLRRIGKRRIIINVDAFDEWLENYIQPYEKISRS